MSNNKKVTSKRVATLASEVLKNPGSSQTAKKLAGSALSQKNKGNQTGSELETLASKVLTSSKYNETTKDLAGSVLAQSNKDR